MASDWSAALKGAIVAKSSSSCPTIPWSDRAAISKLVCGENSLKWALKYSAARRSFGQFALQSSQIFGVIAAVLEGRRA